ncbi:MAG: hypothetical protein V3S55_06405 [Nitrospiraceae bacterium]
MSKSNNLETDILALIFNATTIPELAEDDSTTPATTLTVALHTGDPGEAGNQTTNEISYTGYARIGVARTSGGWTVSGNSVSPASAITFGEMTAGPGGTVTHFSIGTGTADELLYSGTVTPNIVVSNGVTPELTTATAITED